MEERLNLLKYFQIIAIVLIFMITAELDLQAYEPMPDETIFKISDLSDAFIYGEVRSKTFFSSRAGRPRTLYNIKVWKLFFDNIGEAFGKDEIELITNEGLLTGPRGTIELFKELNTPSLSINTSYLLYLKWDGVQNGFILTSGETSLFEVDDQGKVLNFDGVYLLDIKEGRPVLGMPGASKIKQLMSTEREREPGPPAIVTDIYGRARVIEPSPRWFHEQRALDLSADLYLSVEQFLEKLKGKEDEQ